MEMPGGSLVVLRGRPFTLFGALNQFDYGRLDTALLLQPFDKFGVKPKRDLLSGSIGVVWAFGSLAHLLPPNT